MKRSPIRRKMSIRDAFLRKLKREGTKILFKRGGRIERRKPLKKLSRSHRHKLQQYYALRNEFLAQPENENCACCVKRRENGENIRLQPASECHHIRGRAGSLLTDVRFFAATCYDCGRNWIHQHPTEAREMGLLASARDWNRSLPNGNRIDSLEHESHRL